MEDSMIKNLEEKFGKSLPEWISIVSKSGLKKHKEIVDYLKSEYGFTYGYANLVAHKRLKSDAGSAASADDLVEQQYSKGTETLKPIYDKLSLSLKALVMMSNWPPKGLMSAYAEKSNLPSFNPLPKPGLISV